MTDVCSRQLWQGKWNSMTLGHTDLVLLCTSTSGTIIQGDCFKEVANNGPDLPLNPSQLWWSIHTVTTRQWRQESLTETTVSKPSPKYIQTWLLTVLVLGRGLHNPRRLGRVWSSKQAVDYLCCTPGSVETSFQANSSRSTLSWSMV